MTDAALILRHGCVRGLALPDPRRKEGYDHRNSNSCGLDSRLNSVNVGEMTAGTDGREDEWRITPHLSASAALMWCVCLPWGIIGEASEECWSISWG